MPLNPLDSTSITVGTAILFLLQPLNRLLLSLLPYELPAGRSSRQQWHGLRHVRLQLLVQLSGQRTGQGYLHPPPGQRHGQPGRLTGSRSCGIRPFRSMPGGSPKPVAGGHLQGTLPYKNSGLVLHTPLPRWQRSCGRID